MINSIMQRASKTVISRIQNRRGLRQNLPQPLRPGEVALTGDTRQVWIGNEDLPPYGVRTYDRDLNVIDLVSPVLEQQILSVRFNNDLTESQYQSLLNWFRRENEFLFPAFVAGQPNPAVHYNQTVQLQWDRGRYLFFGLRTTELAYAADINPNWLTDPAQPLAAFLALFPDPLPGIQAVRTADQEFPTDLGTGELDWLGQPGLFRVLVCNNTDLQSAALGGISLLINTVSSTDATPEEYVTTLGNIEIGTVDEFEQILDLPPDSLFLNPFRADLSPTGGSVASTGFEFGIDVTDTIFIEYSISTATQAAVGTLRLTAYTGSDVVVFDDRVDTVGNFDVTLTASANLGTLDLQYVNDTADTARLSFVVRRWLS